MKREHRRQLAVFGAIAILFCVGGVVSIVFGVGMYRENRAFADRATAAPGKVIGFETWESGTGSDERENIHYAVVIYKTEDGRDVRFRGPSKDGLVKLKQGDAVRVLYDPKETQTVKVDSFMGLWFGATMLIGVGAGAILVPLLTVWQAWKWAKRQEGSVT
jgi:hypothetical protein